MPRDDFVEKQKSLDNRIINIKIFIIPPHLGVDQGRRTCIGGRKLNNKNEINKRLKSIEGHIRGIQKMVEDDKYCIDIIKQILAVKSAVDKVNSIILKDHLESCVTTAIRSNKQAERQRVITEILDVFETSEKILPKTMTRQTK